MAKRVNDQNAQTLALIEEVKKQKVEIAKFERANWLTNCVFSYIENDTNKSISLHVASDLKELINIVAFLMAKSVDYNDAITMLNIEHAPKFTWCGFTVDDWVTDVKTRINKIQLSTKRKKLESLESRLSAIITPELRAKMELDAITSEMKND